MSEARVSAGFPWSACIRYTRKIAKRIIPLALVLYWIPVIVGIFLGLGLLDFLRNKQRTLSSLDRYLAGKGLCTWMLSPFNLLMDLLTLPYRNRGIYQLADLPEDYQEEIRTLIEDAHQSNLVAKLQEKMGEEKRGMIFFKWYGKNVHTSIDAPELHKQYKYIRTIGVSVFNTKQSTGKHFGPLRVTLRLLYNLNDIRSRDAYIKVGGHINRWCDQKLFIFDDTLQHQSLNESDEVRYCLFVDILRPSFFPRMISAILSGVRAVVARFNYAFYRNWVFIK